MKMTRDIEPSPVFKSKKNLCDVILESIEVDMAFGIGFGGDFDLDVGGASARVNIDLIGVKATTSSFTTYSSVYIGGNASYAGCEIGDEYQASFEWYTGETTYGPNGPYMEGLEKIELSFALYKGLGMRGTISIDSDKIIDYVVELFD